uniref:BH3-interacting domain death agonist n=1 Tax=Callorhinchus milii TaxID=7868 RepID=V9KRG3_CALMI|eukprot:gi/632973488/ref/XP_007903179.1/ PREDICTED: BH3-interacting domain death agonist-like [Callorhinchus milii]
MPLQHQNKERPKMNENASSFDIETQYILLEFLKLNKIENRAYEEEIKKLEEVTKQPFDKYTVEDEDIQTDGHCPSRPYLSSVNGLHRGGEGGGELFRQIGIRLAELGDQLDPKINDNVVEAFLNEGQMKPVSSFVNHLIDQKITVMQDMPREKASLILAMVLLKKTVEMKPSLLQSIFRRTVEYINNNLQNYIQNAGGWIGVPQFL